jgi:hypothetical protein
MSKWMIAAAAASLLLVAGCDGASNPAKPAGPVKRQPGSWVQKISIARLEGKGMDDKARAGLQQMFDALGAMSVCVTPEAAAKEDIAAKLEQAGSNGKDCVFDKRHVAGETVEFSGVCGQGTGKARVSGKGTSTATVQDMTITVDSLDKNLPGAGLMEMKLHSTRQGDCTPRDFTPPATAAQ